MAGKLAACRKALSFAFATLLVMGLVPITSLMSPGSAYAAETGHLTVGDSIPYAGYGTTWFFVDGEMAYCGNPSNPSPEPGSYPKSKLVAPSGRSAETEADLWFSYGSPGFDKSLWPDRWYDGSGMDDEKYAALAHILLSDTFSSNGHYALYGTNESFKSWCRQEVIGFGISGEEINPNATGRKICRMQDQVPSNFTAYMLDTGSTTQIILTFVYIPYGWIDLQKASKDTSITDGNACYSLEGAVYGIYSDSGASKLVASITTDRTGYAKSGDLMPGSYWLREITPPPGYALDKTIYPVTVEGDKTSRAGGGTVYDVPQGDPLEMLLSKYDGERIWTDAENKAQGGASLALAEFTVRYYDGYFSNVADAEKSGAPTRTWIFRTDGDGYVNMALGESTFEYAGKTYPYKVSGDKFYKSLSGNITVPLGTLVIQETKAPQGYLLIDPTTGKAPAATCHQIVNTADGARIMDDEVHTYNMPIKPEQVIRGGVSIVKHDAETGLTSPQGEATLEGTVLAIKNLNKNTVIVEGKEYGYGEVVAYIKTNAQGKATSKADLLPYGHYSIQETDSSTGYLLSDTDPREFDIKENGKIVEIPSDQELYNYVIRGGIEVQKRDLESVLPYPLGGATLEGTVFEITSQNPNPVRVDGIDYSRGEVVKAIVTGEDGKASTDEYCLPYGTYTIKEVDPSLGYLLTDTAERTFSIREHGQIVHLPETDDWKNQVKRGDLEFVKTGEDDMRRLSNVAFDLTSQTTGETHRIVTDDNGYANTASSWNPHTQRTNGNDGATEESYDDEAGIWFGLTQEGWTVDPQDSLGALPFDTYTLTEIPSSNNAGYELITIKDITIKRHGTTIQLGTIDDKRLPEPEIATHATDGLDGDKVVFADSEVVIIDTVRYKNLNAGSTYTVTGTLMDKSTGEPYLIDGSPVTATTTFTPDEPDGKVEVKFAFDGLSITEDTRLTVFEELYLESDLVCDHKDIDDEDQTVTVIPPEIGTQATAEDGISKVVYGDTECTIVDTVAYKNLIPGKTYKLTGTLYSVENRAPIKVGDDFVTASVEFTPESPNGTVEVTFVFDSHELPEGKLVVVEVLTKDDDRIAEHDDIEDVGQTVDLLQPEIGTEATDGEDGDHVVVEDATVTIIDTVSYENLTPGKTYVMHGTLMLKSTGEPLLVDGEPVTAEVEFIPEEPTGFVELTFTFDGRSLAGDSIVAFESLTRDGIEVATHADIEDDDQTIEMVKPEIGTQATDGLDGDHVVIKDSEVTIIDTVEYTNLIPGKTYIMHGTLMDKSTGEPLMIGNEPVTAELEFTPTEANGAVELEFTFDGSALTEGELVAFESLTKDDIEVASHVDIEDGDQTVTVVKPEIGTQACDKADGDKYLDPVENVTIVDRVEYKNLIPGKAYFMTGILMDKSTGEPLMIDGKTVESPLEFTPVDADGYVEMEFTFDASALEGKDIVVFESLTKEGIEVATHTDINDESQTVHVTSNPPAGSGPLSSLAQTGDGNLVAIVALCIMGGIGFMLAVYAYRKRRFDLIDEDESLQ